MLHELQTEDLGPHGEAMAAAVSACVHCGFCLPTCPTYRELGQEMDSPRGRIILMKEVMEGKLELDDALPHIDRCLGCLACEPACPSGVAYRDLISPFRARAESKHRRRGMIETLRRRAVSMTLPHPRRFALGVSLARFVKPLARWLPKAFSPLFRMIPDRLPDRETLSGIYSPEGRKPRARVAFLTGCAQQVLAPEINRAAIDVLLANGVEVIVPEAQGCCGALAWHVGDLRQAGGFAQRNLDAFGEGLRKVDAVVTTAAGCGSGMQEYPLILAGSRRETEALEFAGKVADISAFLGRIGLDPPPPDLATPLTVAYHDACHLSNAQGVIAEPRALLRAISNLDLVEIPDREICCGSAGTYNLDQPEIAANLGHRKAQGILETQADCIVTGNIGCLTQLQHHLREIRGDEAPPIRHTVEILADAYRQG